MHYQLYPDYPVRVPQTLTLLWLWAGTLHPSQKSCSSAARPSAIREAACQAAHPRCQAAPSSIVLSHSPVPCMTLAPRCR